MTKKMISFLLALMMLLSLCACGSSASVSEERAVERMAAGAEMAPAMAYDSAMPAESADEFGGFAMSEAKSTAANGTVSGAEKEKKTPDKIIYSADTTVETTEFDATVAAVSQMMEDCGGWIESSSISGNNYYNKARGRVSTRSASYSLRVPCEEFDAIMNSLTKLGNVPYSHTYTENVTAQYYDTEARLKACQTQEQRLLEMLEIAETVEEVITIEEKLAELRYQIESLQSTLKNWDRQVSYSSIYLDVKEVEEYTPETVVKPSYGEKLLRAFRDGFTGFVYFLSELLLFLVEAFPTLLLLAAIGYGVVKLIGRCCRRRKAKRSKKQEASAKKPEESAEKPEK